VETIAAMSLPRPVPASLPHKTRVDPLPFGLVMALNPMIGLLAPPLGINLFLVDKISGVSSPGMVNAGQPFFVPLAVGSRLMALFPPMVTFLPDPFGVN
jgi:C4-dicarboxylate transporter DctM subunit